MTEWSVEIFEAIEWYLIFIISATAHEAAHAWVAKRGGDLTAYKGGQVSLNPLPHIKREPFGMVFFPLISCLIFGWPFGYATTPYDIDWAYRHPRKAAWMAAAGPGANLVFVLLCILIVRVGIMSGVFMEPYSVNFQHIVDQSTQGGTDVLIVFFSMLFTLNLILFVLNMMPFPPFDGSGVISLFLHDDAARKYRKIVSNPIFGFLGFFLAWQLFSPLFDFIFVAVINLIYPGAGFH